jgi:hypothetical protein
MKRLAGMFMLTGSFKEVSIAGYLSLITDLN